MALDQKFFRKAKKANRAVEVTDLEAIIPASGVLPEVRVALPNRRIRTIEERKETMEKRQQDLEQIEETIEMERKKLLDLVKTYRSVGAGVAEVVVQNLKVKDLMEQRSEIAYPYRWIEDVPRLTLKDIFESKRDIRKIGKDVYMIKHRIEPIESLYVDVAAVAAVAALDAEETEATLAAKKAATLAAEKAAKAKTVKAIVSPEEEKAAAVKGAIIGKSIKLKKVGP